MLVSMLSLKIGGWHFQAKSMWHISITKHRLLWHKFELPLRVPFLRCNLDCHLIIYILFGIPVTLFFLQFWSDSNEIYNRGLSYPTLTSHVHVIIIIISLYAIVLI